MKKLLVLFTVLALAFAGSWIYKIKTPGTRPDSYMGGLTGDFWWNSIGEAEEEVNTNWKLSEGVPNNYIPVPGEKNLYMVVDNDGYITGYKRHVKNEETGEWTWEDVNPDIPENYEAVPNLKDVYKVTYDDGSVKYFKYVRNKDDTYAFVEVDAKGNMIGYNTPEGSEIPANYERVNKNQYAVKDNNGVTIAFRERVVDPSSNTGFKWEDIDAADVSTATASAIAGFNLDTDVTGLGDDTGGNRPYYELPSGGDINITYSIPTLMPQQEVASSSNTGTFIFTQPQQETIITEQIYVTMPPLGGEDMGGYTPGTIITTSDGDKYVVPDTGDTSFIDSVHDGVQQGGTIGQGGNGHGGNTSDQPTMPPYTGMGDLGDWSQYQIGDGGSYEVSQSQTGNIVQRETLTTHVQEGNDMVTYQEIVEKTCDANGNVIQTRSLGKTEIDRQSMTASSGAGDIKSGLNDEYDRIINLLFSKGGQFDGNTPKRMRELINNARVENGKQILNAPGSNDSIYKVALARVSMMALTGSSSRELPSYGTLRSMCAMYGVNINTASENLLAVSNSSAESLNAMLTGSNSDIMSSDGYTHVSIAIAVMNGKMYVCEIFY